MYQILYLSRQNLKRKPFRTTVMIGSIFIACATMFLAIILSRGIQNTLHTAMQRLGADIVVVPKDSVEEAESALISGNPTSFYMPANMENKIHDIKGVLKTAPQVFLRSLDAPCCVAQVALVGYDPLKDLTIGPWLLKNTDKPLQDNQIIVGAKVISSVVGTPLKAVGQRLIFMGKPFTVASILEPTGLGTDFTVFVTMSTAYRMTHDSPLYPVPVKDDQISCVMVKINENDDPAVIAKHIEESIPSIKALTANQLTKAVSGQMEQVVKMLYIAGIIFCILAIVIVSSIFTLSVRQRMREFGLFRAMGAKVRIIFKMIILEGFCIALIGGLLGITFGLLVTQIGKEKISAMLGNLYMWPDISYFIITSSLCFCIALVIGMIAGFYPARNMCKIEIYEAIRKGA